MAAEWDPHWRGTVDAQQIGTMGDACPVCGEPLDADGKTEGWCSRCNAHLLKNPGTGSWAVEDDSESVSGVMYVVAGFALIVVGLLLVYVGLPASARELSRLLTSVIGLVLCARGLFIARRATAMSAGHGQVIVKGIAVVGIILGAVTVVDVVFFSLS